MNSVEEWLEEWLTSVEEPRGTAVEIASAAVKQVSVLAKSVQELEAQLRMLRQRVSSAKSGCEQAQRMAGDAQRIAEGAGSSPQPDIRDEHFYLRCPYSEREAAKARGARWNQQLQK